MYNVKIYYNNIHINNNLIENVSMTLPSQNMIFIFINKTKYYISIK